MTLLIATILIITGIVAGIMTSAAGLGSLVSYPALLALELPPVVANITNTFGLTVTDLSGVAASRRELHGSWHFMFRVMPILLLGCIGGAMLLFIFPERVFAKAVPFFVLIAAILVLLPTSTTNQQWHRSRGAIIGSWVAIFFAGVYSGYFGAACGVIILALLGIITDEHFAVYNAEKNFLMFLANLVSLVVYMIYTRIRWTYVIPLAFGFIIGGYLGPGIVRHIPERVIKIIVAVGAMILAGVLAYQAYA